MNTQLLAISITWPVVVYILIVVAFVLLWPVKPWARPDHDDPNSRITKEEE